MSRRSRERGPPHGQAGGCPAMDCRSGTRDRQHELSEGSLSRMSDAARAAVAEARGAKLCGYCGAVYLNGSRRIIGYLDNGIFGGGWHGL